MTVTMINGEAIDVPAIKARYPHNPVAGYVSGGYPIEWSEADFALFTRKMRIYQQPFVPGDVTDARCIDVETYAATPEDVPAFLSSRADQSDSTVYCSLSTVPLVLEALSSSGVSLRPRWWLAWFWNKVGQPTAQDVLDELYNLTGVTLPASSLWACQYAAYGQWDLSVVYGKQDFSR
jgi:hypothetical protein